MRFRTQDGRIGTSEITPWCWKDAREAADKGIMVSKLFLKIGHMVIVSFDIRFIEPID